MTPITVAICTHNPTKSLLQWALSSLDAQTLAADQFQVVVVDNDSTPPLDECELAKGRRFRLKIVRENRRGVVFARQAAVRSNSSPLMVFVDDDNFLESGYLENALRIAAADPTLGAFGGRAHALVPYNVCPWVAAALPYLGVRDYGNEPIVSDVDKWGEWEPIGAGCVFRREVGNAYLEFVDRDDRAHGLGRKGRDLMSGEDSLLARCAYRVGMKCGYQPSLSLWHYIKPKRLSLKVITTTMYCHGRSHVRLERVLGKGVERPAGLFTAKTLVDRLRYRTQTHGWKWGLIQWFWDIGYFVEARART